MFLRLLIFTFFLSAMNIFAQTSPPIETGVSQALAKWRGKHYSDVRYKLNITLEKGAPLMKGTIEISVKLTDEGKQNDLILDWRTTQFQNDKDKPYARVLEINGTPSLSLDEKPYLIIKEHLQINRELLKTGENVIKIEFASPIKTSGAAITRYVDKEDGAEYVYSLFVPSDASTAFPVFDQPDLKARFTLNLLLPFDWKVVSNTNGKVTDKLIEDYQEVSKTQTQVTLENHRFGQVLFPETKPISTYVFAFAAGDFAEFKEQTEADKAEADLIKQGANIGSKNFSSLLKSDKTRDYSYIYVRKSQAEKFKQHAAEVFRLNREGVRFLESWFDYKFPFPKYDLVLIPEFPFGGMEHAGATFLREDRVIFPTEPTKNDYITRANVIFHEAAHQWFGDTVTMKWFDDLWLKEGFAEFMAYKTLEKVMPEYNAWKIFYERNKQAAYLTDATRGTTPIYQEIENLSAAKSAYGNIVYRKAPSFLRQAEFYLGEDKFQTAVRAFLKKHEFANAEWTDLVKEFELASKQDLKDWANVWVKQRGLPKVSVNLTKLDPKNFRSNPIEIAKNLSKATTLESLGFNFEKIPAEDKQWMKWGMKFKVLIETENKEQIVEDVKFTSGGVRDNLYLDDKKVLFIFPNYQDYGYGIFLLDERSRAYVLANIQTEKDDFLRTMMWGALWDSVRETELNPKDYVELVIKNINVETDESTIQTLLGRVSTAMNYYLSETQRSEIAPRLEEAIRRKMMNAATPGQRITFYRAYLNIASTGDAARFLKAILRNSSGIGKKYIDGKEVILLPGTRESDFMLPLKTKDNFDIAAKLLILGKDEPNISSVSAAEILSELEKTETSDEAKRYAYAAKAGIGTAENKAKFWNDFTNNKELSESYIEAAFVVFNSSKHADLTLPYLEKSLAELPNLKRNRKIFFVNGWLAAFIGGQKSEQALAIVNKFLADNPNLDKDLRLKILENADGLERSVKIRAKFAGR